MSEKATGILKEEAQARRDFLKKAGAMGAAAPAVALLMSAKPAKAQSIYDVDGTLYDLDPT